MTGKYAQVAERIRDEFSELALVVERIHGGLARLPRPNEHR
jgi:hypothetical protein